ncbi:asparaginase [Anaerocolumna sp.]|uniref:asparaginase n=1 Tax=Anaerocolumna sp. TaxID=2041569 RepID=UPI0028A73CA9|nr:asparaginase [Anaerocolumna sp.]
MKKILMIGTGGTIASGPSSNGLVPQLTSDEIIKYIPDISFICQVETIQICNIDSTNISPEIWINLAETIEENYEKYDGFVICHGTDTMAYTAAALSYMVQHSPKPIVLTGAQKPITMEITDSKTNLYDSFLYAASDDASGVQIVFNGKVILGTRARKTHSKSLQSFSSINYPYLALIQDGRIIQYIKQDKCTEPVFYHKLNSKVGLFKLTPGVGEDVLNFMLENYDAIIIESYGVGGIPNLPQCHFLDVIHEWILKGKTVVMTTQVPNEGSDMKIYKVGKELKNKVNLLESYDMIIESVVCKLMWILGQTKDSEEITKLFYKTVSNDILYNY